MNYVYKLIKNSLLCSLLKSTYDHPVIVLGVAVNPFLTESEYPELIMQYHADAPYGARPSPAIALSTDYCHI